MAQFYPDFFIGDQPESKAGNQFERQVFQYLREAFRDNDNLFICHSFRPTDAKYGREIDFLIVDRDTHKLLNLEVKSAPVEGLPDQPCAHYFDETKDINKQLLAAAEELKHTFNEKHKNSEIPQMDVLPFSVLHLKPPDALTDPEKNEGILTGFNPGGLYLSSRNSSGLNNYVSELLCKSPDLYPTASDAQRTLATQSLEKWVIERSKSRIYNKIRDLAKVNHQATGLADAIESTHRKKPLLLTGYAGTGKTETMKIAINHIAKTESIIALTWNDLLCSSLSSDICNSDRNITVKGVHTLIREIAGEFRTEADATCKNDIATIHNENLHKASVNIANKDYQKHYDHLFIDEGQDFTEAHIQFLLTLCPSNKTKWWVNFDTSQQWRRQAISFSTIDTLTAPNAQFHLKTSLRLPDKLRRQVIAANTKIDEAFFKQNHLPPVGEVFHDSLTVTNIDQLQIILDDILNDKEFRSNFPHNSEIALLTSQSYDRINGQAINGKTTTGAWVFKQDFEGRYQDLHYDTILRSKGLEFIAVIILMGKSAHNYNMLRYIAETRSQSYIKILLIDF